MPEVRFIDVRASFRVSLPEELATFEGTIEEIDKKIVEWAKVEFKTDLIKCVLDLDGNENDEWAVLLLEADTVEEVEALLEFIKS